MAGFESNWSPAVPEVRVSYGPQDVNEAGGGQASDSGTYKEAVYEFDFEQMHDTYAAGNGLELQYHPGTIITAVRVQDVDGNLAGTFAMDLSDGTNTAIVVATLGVLPTGKGNWTEMTVAATAVTGENTMEALFGEITAGRAKVVVTYLDSQNRAGK